MMRATLMYSMSIQPICGHVSVWLRLSDLAGAIPVHDYTQYLGESADTVLPNISDNIGAVFNAQGRAVGFVSFVEAKA